MDRNRKFSVKTTLATLHSCDNAIEISGALRQELQSVLLSMFLDVAAVCKKHGISVFLCGGSALGAVRHGGFIPWDEDRKSVV